MVDLAHATTDSDAGSNVHNGNENGSENGNGSSPAMSFDFAMPSLGADMDEGRVIEWRVAPGDTVQRGDLIALVETEKSDIDVEIWHGGIVEELLVDIGALVDVGTPIVRLRVIDGDVPSQRLVGPPSSDPSQMHANGVDDTPGLPPPNGHQVVQHETSRVAASPMARRRAADRGVDLSLLRGSGPGGVIVEADVLAAAPAASRPITSAPSAHPRSTDDARRSSGTMRNLIAERMSTANREIPHYHLSRDLDIDALTSWLADENSQRPVAERILTAACLVRAVAIAASHHRNLNGFWINDHFEPAGSINVAVVVALRKGGLVTPQIEHADERSIEEIMVALGRIVSAARTGTLRAAWMTGATITVTNLGDTGADLVHGLISPPQVALVGFGRPRLQPWATRAGVDVRPVITSTLAADHRATDGAIGSRFLATIANLTEHPDRL